MRSAPPKPLHLLCGRAMLLYVLDALAELRGRPGRGRGRPRRRAGHQEAAGRGARPRLDFVEQHVQRGTGDAVASGSPPSPTTTMPTTTTTCSCCPATRPLLRPTTIAALVDAAPRRRRGVHVLTGALADPTGYGRVVRGKDDRVARIVEERDATAEERAIDEINTSIYCFRRSVLAPALRRLQPRERAGRVLPDRRRRGAARRRLPGGRRGGRRPGEAAGRQRPGPAGRGRGRAAPAHQRRWLQQGVTMVDPDAHLRRRHRASWPPTSRSSPARSCRAAPSSAGRRDRPRHPPRRLRGRRRRRASSSRPATTPRSAPAPSSARTPCSSPGASIPAGTVTGPFYTATGDRREPAPPTG